MALVRAHSFLFSFDIHMAPGYSSGAKRRAALRWLVDRTPPELRSIHYDAQRGTIRVEMIVRIGWSVEQLNRYANAVEALCLAHIATVDETMGRAEIDASRAQLCDALGEAALPEPH
jgi:hypothetical protein